VPGESEHSNSKIKGPSDWIQKQNGDFLENGSNDFDYISVIYGDHVSKQNCVGRIFRKTTV
jgi:hypothetical protein